MDSDIEGRVRAFWEQAFNGRELDLIDAITAPEFVNHNALPDTPPGPEGHRQVVQRLWGALSRRPLRDQAPGQRRRHGHLHRDDVRDPGGHAAWGARLGAAIGHLQVVLPVARRSSELPSALEGVVARRGREALGERGVVAPDAQHAVVERDAVCPAHAARVEVLRDQPVAGLRGADDADCIGEQPLRRSQGRPASGRPWDLAIR